MTNYEFCGIIIKINCTSIEFRHSIYRTYIYYHDMYKNELNQQNKGDDNHEKNLYTKTLYNNIYVIKGIGIQNKNFCCLALTGLS